MIASLAAACIFLLGSLYFIRGKGSSFLLRLHAVPENDNGTYDLNRICRFIGFVLLLFSLGTFLWCLGRAFHRDIFLTLSFMVWIGTALFILIYLNTGERFWTLREDYVPFSQALKAAEESAAEDEASGQIEDIFGSISVRGRVAYGAACLETAASALQARTEKMGEFLELLWSFTSVILFDEWEERAEAFRTELETFSSIFGLEGLEEEDKTLLFQLQREALEAATENLKKGQSGFTLEPTIRLVKLMWKNGLPLPSMKPFRRSSIEESGGWGDPRDPDFFRDFSLENR